MKRKKIQSETQVEKITYILTRQVLVKGAKDDALYLQIHKLSTMADASSN